MQIFGMPPKAPDEILDYKIDMTAELKGRGPSGSDDTLSTVNWTVPPSLLINAQSNDASTATIWLAGGVLGKTYEVAAVMVTSPGGRTYHRSFTIAIQDR